MAVTPTPRRFSCRISPFDMDAIKGEHLDPSVAARTRSCRGMQDLVSLDVHVLLRKRSAQPVPNGWMASPAAVGLHTDRGHHFKYCFLSLSTSAVHQRPRRPLACVPLQPSCSSHLQILRFNSIPLRSRCFVGPLTILIPTSLSPVYSEIMRTPDIIHRATHIIRSQDRVFHHLKCRNASGPPRPS